MDSFEIDQNAQRILHNSLPAAWLIREQNPDVHVDYSIEIREEGEPTGTLFYCQLKGCVKPDYRRTGLVYPLKRKHLRYYLEKLKIPVFLVVADTLSGMSYWLFLQQYLKELPNKVNLHKGKTLSVKIPLGNLLSDLSLLKNAIESAEIYMRELWPGSVEAAVNHEKERLEKLDNRFSVDVLYDGTLKFHAKSNSNLEIEVRCNSEDAFNKFQNVMMTGNTEQFDAADLNFSGSKLFTHLKEKFDPKTIVIGAGKSFDCEIYISVVDESDDLLSVYNPLHHVMMTTGEMAGGLTSATFEGKLRNTAFSVNGTISLNKGVSFFKLNFDADNWAGQNILYLAYFDKLYNFFEYLFSGYGLSLIVEKDGNRLFGSRLDKAYVEKIVDNIYPCLNFIKKAREVSKFLNINPMFPLYKNITSDDFNNIEQLFEIIENGKVSIDSSGTSISCELQLPNPNLLTKLSCHSRESIFRIVENFPAFSIWGETTEKYLNQITLQGFELSDETISLLEETDLSSEGTIKIRLSGDGKSLYKRELLPVAT